MIFLGLVYYLESNVGFQDLELMQLEGLRRFHLPLGDLTQDFPHVGKLAT